MVPIENQERPNIKSVYTCSNCEKALAVGLLSATLQVFGMPQATGYLLHLLARGVPCDQLPWL